MLASHFVGWYRKTTPRSPPVSRRSRGVMHTVETTFSPIQSTNGRAWYRELNSYHWFVLVVAALGWLFDCLDQQLFNLARKPAITELLGAGVDGNTVDSYS